MAKALLICNNLHSPAAENEGRADKYGIAYHIGDSYALFNIGYGKSLGLRYFQFLHYLFKGIPVFRAVDSLNVGADNRNSERVKRRRKVNRSLTAEGYDYTERFFKLDNIHYVLNRKRLKIEFVRGSVVGRYGFGVVVDYNRFIARVPD